MNGADLWWVRAVSVQDEIASQFRKIRSSLAKVRALRDIIRHDEGQLRRDAAIITYTRLIDDLILRLHALDDAGAFERAQRMFEAETGADH